MSNICIRLALPLALTPLFDAAWAADTPPLALPEKYRCTIRHPEVSEVDAATMARCILAIKN
jgi:hypothetical protein